MNDIELEWKQRSGEPIVVRCSGHRVEGNDGGPDYFEIFAEDVTERRTLERQLLWVIVRSGNVNGCIP